MFTEAVLPCLCFKIVLHVELRLPCLSVRRALLAIQQARLVYFLNFTKPPIIVHRVYRGLAASIAGRSNGQGVLLPDLPHLRMDSVICLVARSFASRCIRNSLQNRVTDLLVPKEKPQEQQNQRAQPDRAILEKRTAYEGRHFHGMHLWNCKEPCHLGLVHTALHQASFETIVFF